VAAEQDGDQSHDALGQCGAGRRQDRAHRDRAHLELDAQPFDGVDEPLARQIDDGGAAEQKNDVNHEASLSR
jgi:hypothetical protein